MLGMRGACAMFQASGKCAAITDAPAYRRAGMDTMCSCSCPVEQEAPATGPRASSRACVLFAILHDIVHDIVALDKCMPRRPRWAITHTAHGSFGWC